MKPFASGMVAAGIFLSLLAGCVKEENLADRAGAVIAMLGDRRLERLANYVHPSKGVRFSPSAHIDLKTDRVLSAEQFGAAMEDKAAYLWGFEDASGEPIKLSFRDYFERFIYDADFARAEQTAVDNIIGRSATVNNLTKVYSAGRFVEYHFSGFDPRFEGMDWKSLRLVFEQQDGIWFLVGIVHDQWGS